MTLIKYLIIVIIIASAKIGYSQADAPCCTVIDMVKDSGTVLIRDYREGWIKRFKPDALEFASLKIGDSVYASAQLQQVSKVNGMARRYPLMQPLYRQPCCEITYILQGHPQFTITARKTTGDTLQFQIPDSLATALIIGSPIYTSPSHGYAMVLAPTATPDSIFYGFPFLQQ